MTLSEKSAYLKGLMDGLKLDTDKNEGKLIAAIIDMLSDVAENVADLEDVVDCISDELDCIEEDLDNIDEYLLDDEDDDEDAGCRGTCCGASRRNGQIPHCAARGS